MSASSSSSSLTALAIVIVVALLEAAALVAVSTWYRDAAGELQLLQAHMRNVGAVVLVDGGGGGDGACGDALRRGERAGEARLATQLLECELASAQLRRDPRFSALQRRVSLLHARASACASSRDASSSLGRRLSYVLPFVEGQLARVSNLLHNVWAVHPPCNASAPLYARHVELVLYAARPLGADALDHARLADQLQVAVAAGGSRACWSAVRVVVANLTRVPPAAPSERYARKPVADHFFSVLDAPALRQHADYIAYFEPDTLPVRALWLDRLYEQVEHGGDFWLKGSLYRGPNQPLDFCYSLCGCAEHINGNAIHALHDERYVKFLRSVYRQMDFLSFNYDAFIMNRLKAPENWRFFQEHAHRFQYTEFIMHGQHTLPVAELVARYNSTYLVHQPLL